MKQLTGIILAGGKSSRVGKEKGFLELNGKKFVQHTIDAMQPLVDEIIIISNNADYTQFGCKVYPDLISDCGPIGGIYTGLSKSSTEKNLILSCDMPDLKTKTLVEIVSQVEQEEATVPIHDGFLEPLCAVYSKLVIEKLKTQIDAKHFKISDALKKMKVKYVQFDGENQFENINTLVEFENRKQKNK